jgi:hypothetical protein
MARTKGANKKPRTKETIENIRQAAIEREHRKVLEYLESD